VVGGLVLGLLGFVQHGSRTEELMHDAVVVLELALDKGVVVGDEVIDFRRAI
jgi:hypothetical protein